MPSRDAYAVWLADAWISMADYTNDILTLYDGVEWGFTIAATPLPTAWTMMMIGMSGVGFVAYRGRNRKLALPAA